MTSDNSNKHLSIPQFESKLPAEFTKGLDDRGQFLYTEMDKNSQKLEWLLNHSIEQATILAEVKAQTTKTNGRLLIAEEDIKEIKATQLEMKPAVAALQATLKVMRSKWFWVGAFMVVAFVFPWVATHAPTPSEFVKIVFGL